MCRRWLLHDTWRVWLGWDDLRRMTCGGGREIGVWCVACGGALEGHTMLQTTPNGRLYPRTKRFTPHGSRHHRTLSPYIHTYCVCLALLLFLVLIPLCKC